jgi:CRP/FNR family transcriptional regulator, cyclic AMP receptor protein
MVSIVRPSAALLREIKVLQALTDAELTHLISLGVAHSHRAHSNIIIEGELSWGLYLLMDGVVGIYKTNKLTGDSYDIGMLKNGSFFGEMSLIDENPRSATVRALSDTQTFFISRDSFQSFINQSKDLKQRFYESCIRTLVMRLREVGDGYVISQYQLWKAS